MGLHAFKRDFPEGLLASGGSPPGVRSQPNPPQQEAFPGTDIKGNSARRPSPLQRPVLLPERQLSRASGRCGGIITCV
jgi:hypothetical protein